MYNSSLCSNICIAKEKDILNHGSDTNVELKQNLLVRIRFLIVGSITSMSFQLL